MKCTCQWIDNKGEATPDDNEAIAMAVCYNPISFGEKGCEPFAICEAHAKLKSRHWKLLPLPGTSMEESHSMVQYDHQFFPKVISDVVIEAVKKSFPSDADDILKTIKWDSMNGCYHFNRWGMYVGVEEDGYIHT